MPFFLLRPCAEDGRDRLLTHGLGSVDRSDDPAAHAAMPDDDWRKNSRIFRSQSLSKDCAKLARVMASVRPRRRSRGR